MNDKLESFPSNSFFASGIWTQAVCNILVMTVFKMPPTPQPLIQGRQVINLSLFASHSLLFFLERNGSSVWVEKEEISAVKNESPRNIKTLVISWISFQTVMVWEPISQAAARTGTHSFLTHSSTHPLIRSSYRALTRTRTHPHTLSVSLTHLERNWFEDFWEKSLGKKV